MTKATGSVAALARTAILLGLAATLTACGPGYSMKVPEGFSSFELGDDFKMISADGVRLKAREVENYPRASLEFWTDAMRRHLVARGYVLKRTADKAEKRCFRTTRGLPGCTMDFLIPRGEDDWVFSVTLFVVEDRIILVEAAGPYARFAKVEGKIAAALSTFVP